MDPISTPWQSQRPCFGLFRRVVGLIQRPCRSTMSPVREPNPEMCDGLPRRQNRVTEQSRCFALQSKAEAKWHCTRPVHCHRQVCSHACSLPPMARRGAPGGGASPSFKVVLLGEGRVGKTSLVVRYVRQLFNDKQQPTIQVGTEREGQPPASAGREGRHASRGAAWPAGRRQGHQPVDGRPCRAARRSWARGRAGGLVAEGGTRARKEGEASAPGWPAGSAGGRAGGRAGARARGLALRLRAVP